jgi:hypothetical protein
MLKLDGLLGAYSPALSAARAFGHIVLERPLFSLITIVQRRSRTVLHTGQTTVAFIVNAKVRHNVSPIFIINLQDFRKKSILGKGYKSYFKIVADVQGQGVDSV